MNSKFLFSSLLLAAGMIPNVALAQGNCTAAAIVPAPACIIPQNANGTLFTMVYRLTLNNVNSCVMTPQSNNDGWPFPDHLKAYTNENNPGHQPRPYSMAKLEGDGAYTITNTPSTFACVKNIGPDATGAFSSELDYNFSNNGMSISPYIVAAGQTGLQLCSSQVANQSISAAEYTTINSACGVNFGTLPVTLISFGGREQSGSIVLNWKTASELNFNNFEIQRSTDGIQFATIAVVFGAESNTATEQNYSYKDNAATLSGHLMYRLKMNDRDGHVKYSNIVTFRLDSSAGEQLLYPNPIAPGSVASLAIQSDKKQQAKVSVYAIDGTQLAISTIQLSEGTQTFSVPGASRLVPGIYSVTVSTSAGEIKTHRLVVQ